MTVGELIPSQWLMERGRSSQRTGISDREEVETGGERVEKRQRWRKRTGTERSFFERTAVVLETQRELTLRGFTEYISPSEDGRRQQVTEIIKNKACVMREEK